MYQKLEFLLVLPVLDTASLGAKKLSHVPMQWYSGELRRKSLCQATVPGYCEGAR